MVVLAVGAVVHVQRPQLVSIQQQAVAGLAGVQAGQAGGEAGFMGEATGVEGFGEAAFAQLPGPFAELGAAQEGIGGGLLALPAGMGRAWRCSSRRAEWPEMETLVLTAFGTVQSAVEAMSWRIRPLQKPIANPETLRLLVGRALERSSSRCCASGCSGPMRRPWC